jgi:hypothetical protein
MKNLLLTFFCFFLSGCSLTQNNTKLVVPMGENPTYHIVCYDKDQPTQVVINTETKQEPRVIEGDDETLLLYNSNEIIKTKNYCLYFKVK